MGKRNRTNEHPRKASGRDSESGFTLLEALVALVVMIVVLVGLLSLLQLNSRVAKAQINVAGMQQSLRVAHATMIRELRMTGRGGLPAFRPATGTYDGIFLPQGLAVGVRNNVQPGTPIGGAGSPDVLAGTDVLTIRGVFTAPLYQINAAEDGVIGNTGADKIIIRGLSPGGLEQPLDALEAAIQSGLPEALLLIGSADDSIQAVVELTGGAEVDGGWQVNFTTAGTHGAQYLHLSPNGEFPSTLTSVAAVGILEEYRYYVRDAAPAPRLAVARFYPGTDAEYGGAGAGNLAVDVADNIIDLQLALGIDRNLSGAIDEAENALDDDWLFNAEDDDPDPDETAEWNQPDRRLFYLRITTLARTDRIDLDYLSPPIEAIEDHVYGEAEAPAAGEELERKYRRRLLQTVVDLRNVL